MASDPLSESAIEELMRELRTEKEPDLGGPYYDTPDGASGIASAVWKRLEISSLEETFNDVKASLSLNGGGPNGVNESIELPEDVFKVSDEESAKLAEVAGSYAAREVVHLLRSAEAATENSEPADGPDRESADEAA
jgi:hypothetical protein